jgi:hypothetical protein
VQDLYLHLGQNEDDPCVIGAATAQRVSLIGPQPQSWLTLHEWTRPQRLATTKYSNAGVLMICALTFVWLAPQRRGNKLSLAT